MDLDPGMPLARQHDLTATPSGDELLVYDRARHHIHHLNRLAAAVWLACDGRQPVATLAATLSIELGIAVSPEAVRLALTQLADANLLATPLAAEGRLARPTRRHLLKAAATGLAVPAIASVTAPSAAAAVSCGLAWEDCTNQDCCDGTCVQGTCCPADVCGGTCCSYGTCFGDRCCPAELICGGMCCDSQCIDGICCPPPFACGDVCCDFNSSNCVNGACCPISQVCGIGDVCCAEGTTCLGSECCDDAFVCGDTCCPDTVGRCDANNICQTASGPL